MLSTVQRQCRWVAYYGRACRWRIAGNKQVSRSAAAAAAAAVGTAGDSTGEEDEHRMSVAMNANGLCFVLFRSLSITQQQTSTKPSWV